MTRFDDIRPYHDHEVHEALQEFKRHPLVKVLLGFAFPNLPDNEIDGILDQCHSIKEFQQNVIYVALKRLLENTTEGFTTSGFDKLQPETSYLFISNHRDIVLDTSLLNVALLEHGLVMTASAIGDNLVGRPFLMALSRLNRNFLIQRDLPPRELLKSSQLVSDYIYEMLFKEHRSVWIAQREGRAKDGDDKTQQGVLKMLAMASDEANIMDYFKKMKVVPVAISYEYDPTDILKVPELVAKHHDEEYVKTGNEDFNAIMKGALGKKKRIHIEIGDILEKELDEISRNEQKPNKQLQALASLIDDRIIESYKLWPSKYIAYDLMHGGDKYAQFYTEKEKKQFERRIERRVDRANEVAMNNYLAMYANPVINKEQLT
ncbi:1-acyl-sn-glycerol-3-phosphate acyltransferase [Sungkyunkwania multivorans]|uniref:1-acyl-sn-glycerol-3-phosphate acyltransferase n=1 Tax=Sungkyunkwania multivorans TaxID=1173618 RepID=A0ABW3CUC5_9FLAO